MKKSLAFLFMMFVALATGCVVRNDGVDPCKDTTCAPGAVCQPNSADPTSPVCVQICDNDGQCEAGETTNNCSSDCPATICDNDGVCDEGETLGSCAGDCGNSNSCGDGICSTTEPNCVADCCGDGICLQGEQAFCQDDCAVVPVCGNDLCEEGETASSCSADCGTTCGDGLCEAGENVAGSSNRCPTDCVGVCGNNICEANENVSNCDQDCDVPNTCGNGSCEQGENAESCFADCGQLASCGNGVCERTTEDEDGSNCPTDCHPNPAIDLGGFCVGFATDWSNNDDNGVVMVFSNGQHFLLTVTQLVGNDEYLKWCNVPVGTYDVSYLDCNNTNTSACASNPESNGSYAFYGDPEVYDNLTDAALCWIDQDTLPSTGYHIKFTMQSNGHAVGVGDRGAAACPDPTGTTSPFCGDGTCNNGETQSSCSADCGVPVTCDNDGICESGAGETASNCSNDCGATTTLQAPAAGATVSGQVRCVGFDVSYITGSSSGITKQWEQYSPSFLQDNIADQNANATRVERCNFNQNQIYEGTYKDANGNYALYGIAATLSQISDANKQVVFQDQQGNIKLRFKFDSSNTFVPCGNKGNKNNSLPSGCN